MLTFTATVTGAEKAAAELTALSGKMQNLRGLFEQVLEPDIYEWQAERFDQEGKPERWARLSDRYAAWKARRYPGRRILEREGLLREGLTRRGGRFQVRRVTDTSLELGTSAPYAQFHQFGTRRMPRREIVTITGDDERRWARLAEDYFARVAKGSA